MSGSKLRRSVAHQLVFGVSAVAIAAASAPAFAQTTRDEIVVTSQRVEQSIQDVPIAVSALSADDLASKQIDGFSDIQLNVPNFSFTRSQFTTSSIVIRGIGALAVGADTEPALSIHLNDQPLSAPRLFETEFYDVERVEVLRGPQGTLFGRNATGGVVDIITNKASTDGYSADAEFQYGNYNHVQVKGALNVPLSDTLAVRIAGITTQQDGFSKNLFTGQDVDDRNVSSVRGSIRWLPTDNTTVDLTAQYLTESDRRMRSTKTLCTADPTGVRGCVPGQLGFDQPTLPGTLNLLASSEALATILQNPGAAQFGLFSIADPTAGASAPANPANFRQINTAVDPRNDVEETIFNAVIRHDFDNFTVKLIGGYGDSKIAQLQAQNNLTGPKVTINPAYAFAFPNTYNGLFADGKLPVSNFNQGLTGAMGGSTLLRSNYLQAVDFSRGSSKYWSVEGNVSTAFDGPFNFLLGANYSTDHGFADFYTSGNALDYTAATLATLAVADGTSAYVPFFFNNGFSKRKSTSVFGEVYWNLTDTLKLTGGLRYNHDVKSTRDRATLFESFLALADPNPNAVNQGLAPPVVPIGTPDVTGFLDPNPLVQGDAGAVNDFRVAGTTFDEVTGRAVLEWQATDSTNIYASYSRGYKPGGFNPPLNPTQLATGIKPTYDPEFINAYEVGLKFRGLDNTVTANLSGFYYDYSGLQVSRIVARTSLNDNIDAKIWGLEGEFLWAPDDHWQFNLTPSYLHTKMGKFAAFDPANPTAGDPDADLFKDVTNASNCVVKNNGAPSLIGQLANPLAPAGPGNPVITPFTVCNQLLGPAIAARNTFLNTNYELLNGIDQDLSGNELPGSPNWQVAIGAQYTAYMGNLHVTPRIDYYRQGDFVTRIFNTANDTIDGWGVFNASIEIKPSDGPWYIRGYIQNAFNKENITGSFLQDQSSGLVTNAFLLDPRTYGVAIGGHF